MQSSKDILVSVVMSVYNCETYITDAIDSILNQSFSHFEFIIIDDGSTDKTLQIIRKYNDPRIIVVSRENKGLVTSLNEGIEVARGKYIARQDADDISSLDRLELQVDFLEKSPLIGLVGSSYEVIDEESNYVSYVTLLTRDNDIRKDFLIRNPFCHGSTMFRKSAAKQAGLYKKAEYPAEDYGFFLRISQQTKVANLPTYLYYWRKESASISHLIGTEQEDALVRMLNSSYAQLGAYLRKSSAPKDFKKGLIHYSSNIYKPEFRQQYVLSYSKIPIVMWAQGDRLDSIRFAYRILLQRPRTIKLIAQLSFTKKDWLYRKRPAILITRCAENYFGGAERFILQLSKILIERHEQVIVSTTVEKLSSRLNEASVSLVPGDWLENKAGKRTLLKLLIKLPHWLYRNYRLMNKRHIGIINAHSRDDQIMFTITKGLHRRKVIWTDHGDMKHHISYLKDEKYIRKIYFWAIAHVDAIIFVSSAERTLMENELKALKIKLPKMLVVPNGIMLTEYATLSASSGNKRNPAVTLGIVCNLFEAKGVDIFLETVSALRTELATPIKGIVVGDGPSKLSLLKLRSKLGLDNVVVFEGFRENIVPYLEKIDIFLLPTQYEGAPISTLEAMYARIPVIAYDVGGLSEQIKQGETGFLAQLNDKGELKSVTTQLIKSPRLRSEVGDAARARVEAEFDLERIVNNKYIPLLFEIYNNRKSRGRN